MPFFSGLKFVELPLDPAKCRSCANVVHSGNIPFKNDLVFWIVQLERDAASFGPCANVCFR